jgi:hypothetical protein
MDHQKATNIGFSCLILCLMGLCFIGFAVAEDSVPGYYDWKCYVTSHIGEYTTAPAGYEYVVIILYIQNDGDQSITTSPSGWNLIADGIKYEHDASTFDRSIGYQDIEIVKGRNIETKIVYLVKGKPTNIHLQFDGIWGIGPTFKEINHYVNRTSL